MTEAAAEEIARRSAWPLLMLLPMAVLIGGLVAPPVFHGLVGLGRHVPALSGLRNVEFVAVVKRSVMVLALAGLWPALRRAGMARRSALGLQAAAGVWGAFLKGLLAGVLSLAVLWAVGWRLGVYAWNAPATSALVRLLLRCGVAALVVGCLEEFFFRGVIFGAMRRGMGWWGAALLSSLFYAWLHFAAPEPPLGVVHVQWFSGLALLKHAPAGPAAWMAVWPSLAILFLAGVIFCRLYERRGDLALAAGLHAGWVWVMLMGLELFSRQFEELPLLFGSSGNVARTYPALMVALVAAALLLRFCPAKKRGGETG
jgi:membrane protease YdiL (CAAX protease family)